LVDFLTARKGISFYIIALSFIIVFSRLVALIGVTNDIWFFSRSISTFITGLGLMLFLLKFLVGLVL
jgi:hypothetical protein